MGPNFNSANLALTAYFEVLADGTSPDNNSGVTTAKTATGTYTVTLPADKTQVDARDLVFVQVKGSGATPMSSKVDETSAAVKTIYITNSSTLADAPFSAVIFRTIIPPPTGAPA